MTFTDRLVIADFYTGIGCAALAIRILQGEVTPCAWCRRWFPLSADQRELDLGTPLLCEACYQKEQIAADWVG